MAIHPPMESFYAVPGSAAEYRQRVQHAAEERAALRTSELAEQVSPMKDVEERIRIWERLHALRLPRVAGHVLVRVIATQTRLTLDQVHEEQQRRAAMIARPKASPSEGGALAASEPVQADASTASPRDG